MAVTLRWMYKKKTLTGQADFGVRGSRPPVFRSFSTPSLADRFKLDIILNFILLGG